MRLYLDVLFRKMHTCMMNGGMVKLITGFCVKFFSMEK